VRGSISFDNAIGVQPHKVSIYSKEEIAWLILKARQDVSLHINNEVFVKPALYGTYASDCCT